MEYLLKASAVIVIFYTCYKLCLQRDTFFEQNRWFLLVGLITAFFIPLVVIPIYVEQTPIDLNNLVFVENQAITNSTSNSLDVLSLLKTVYLLGIIVFSVRFILQITSLLPLIVKSKNHKLDGYSLVKTTEDISPFSFFNYIVYNPKQFNNTELEQIIAHEKVHVRQHHTVDILLAQLSCIVFWFNPFIWFYNKDLKQNLEFIADKTAINVANCKKSYQYTLLKTSMPTHQLALTNNFYNSLIKKRIVMLHKSKSKKINLLKFALIIPALALFLMSFNTKEVIIEKKLVPTNSNTTKDIPVFNQILNNATPHNNTVKTPIEKTHIEQLNIKKSKSTNTTIDVIITKDFSDNDLDKLKTKFKNEGLTLKIKGVKRNKQGEITAIKIDVSSKSSNANYSIDTDEAINPIKISVDDKGKNISIGNGHKIKGQSMVFVSDDGKKHVINHSGSGNNVFVISSDDNDVEFDSDVDVEYVVKSGDSIHVKNIHKNVNADENIIFITKGGDDKIVHKMMKIKEDKKKGNKMTWTISEDEDVIIKSKNKDGNIEIITEDGKEPLYMMDGKEITKEDMDDLNPDSIEKVKVLKGDSATEKYGNKGKNGVILITTKKKN